MSVGNRNDGITILISANSIYENSLSTVKLIARKPFWVILCGTVISILQGRVAGEYILAKEKDGIYSVEAEIIGLFRERRIDESRIEDEHTDIASNTYGMRFYPFVSSEITGKIAVRRLPISSIIFDLPDAFRFIWKDSFIKNPSGDKSFLSHSYGQDRSRYVFRWSQKSIEGEYILDNLPVRLGGATLLKLTEFPTIYLVFYLIAISIIAFADWKLLAGTIIAVWLFMLQQFNSANVPQRSVFLRSLYTVEGVIIAVWGIVWELTILFSKNCPFLYFFTPLLASCLIFIIVSVFRSIKTFEYTGKFPKSLENYWTETIIKRIEAQEKHLLEK